MDGFCLSCAEHFDGHVPDDHDDVVAHESGLANDRNADRKGAEHLSGSHIGQLNRAVRIRRGFDDDDACAGRIHGVFVERGRHPLEAVPVRVVSNPPNQDVSGAYDDDGAVTAKVRADNTAGPCSTLRDVGQCVRWR